MDDKNQRLYLDKFGQRKYTPDSLREKIEDQYIEETSGRSDILAELDTRQKRIDYLTEVADYVLSQEYIDLPPAEKRKLIDIAVANLFYFGSLDATIRDDTVSEITVEGPWEVGVRRGFGEITRVDSPFVTLEHLKRTLTAILTPAGTYLSEAHPILELGVRLHERPVRLSLLAPPVAPMYSLQMRLHPAQPITLDQLSPDILSAEDAQTLLHLVKDGQGVMVTGEQGTGKTTLLAALVNALDAHDHIAVIERAEEMHLPEGLTRAPAVPPQLREDAESPDFAEQITRHAGHQTLVIDEIRGDEARAFWEALNAETMTHGLIAFRGTSDAARLYSALSMVIRKGDFGLTNEAINATILAKLPYVAALHRRKGEPTPRLVMLGQWVPDGDKLTIQELKS